MGYRMLYELSRSDFQEYREAVAEKIGTRRENSIYDIVARRRMASDPIFNHEVIDTNEGHTLFYDPIGRRYFLHDIERVRKAVSYLNQWLSVDDRRWVTLNDLYSKIGLDRIPFGDSLVWNSEGGVCVRLSTHPSDDGTPCQTLIFSGLTEKHRAKKARPFMEKLHHYIERRNTHGTREDDCGEQ